jgi:hypothetical protein
LEAVSKDTVQPAGDPLAVGQTVRIIRPPHANQTGAVTHIYQQKRLTTIGTRVYGADIKLADGTAVFVPIANLEAII